MDLGEDRRPMADIKSFTTQDSGSSKGRILVVDEETRHVESLAMMLDEWGYDVETATDGSKAAGILMVKSIDLILLDFHMPESGSLKLMDFIRRRKLKTQVIAISGDYSMDDAICSFKKGADHFIRKPVSPADLLNAIDESLKKHAYKTKKDGIKRKAEIKSNLHRLMFDIAPNLLFLLDAKGCFRMVNNVFCKVTGYTKQELLGMHWKSLVESDEVERMQHVFEERRTTPDEFPEVELRLKCKGSSSRTPELKSRTVLVALQSRRVYSRQDKKKIFFGTYGVARDITHYNKLEELNKYREFHDDLTGLPNRVLFDDYLNFALTQARHSNTGLCLINLVLGDLKRVNDCYGHGIGDACLKILASRLRRQIRKGDTLARIEGSEFLMLLPNIRDESALAPLVEKVRTGLTEAVVVDGKSIALQVSVGLALFPRDGGDAEALLHQIRNDAALVRDRKQPQTLMNGLNWIKLIQP
jgi:diguanylate cyclase (GGDEF)-like protein/PAS domain S-box-containing protein